MSGSPFMLRAIELARQGMLSGAGGPFGAVIVSGGEIVGEGWNRVLATNDPTAHGEITAIRDACARLGRFSLADCEIYTTGEPCPMCLGAIQWARIAKIYYGFSVADAATAGFDDLAFYQDSALPSPNRRIPSQPLAVGEALALLAEYRALPNRVAY
jgi:tRNA(Arg) A34 adenosine deaminase TadA